MPMVAAPSTVTGGPIMPMQQQMTPGPVVMTTTSDGYAKDAIINWFRGEFAAANAIIDVLCGHLSQLARNSQGGGVAEYDAVFTALHQRRLNWIPVLQMQKYHSIADFAVELKKLAAAAAKKTTKTDEEEKEKEVCLVSEKIIEEKMVEVAAKEDDVEVEVEDDPADVITDEDDSPSSDITHAGGSNSGVVGFSLFCRVSYGQGKNFTKGQNNKVCLFGMTDKAIPRFRLTVHSAPAVRFGSQDGQQQAPIENADICLNHEECEGRASQIKLTKGFTAKEQVRGHMVNVVKGLKLYEDIFSELELSKLTDFVTEMRTAGQNGELQGDTFVLFNKHEKGNKKERIQLGVPIFGHIQDEAAGTNIEPIPELLESVIDHLIQWRLLPEFKRPNGCVINFFDEDEFSQPIQKPPHLDQPIATLLLSESKMAYGRTLTRDNEGNYRGPIMLSLKEGSLLVMRGNSCDMARHVMCPSPNKRVTITLVRVRPESYQMQSPPTSPCNAMAVWQPQPAISSVFAMPNGAPPLPPNGHEPMDSFPKWGIVPSPVLMFAPSRSMVMTPRKLPRGGTGVFLPWNSNSRKPTRHLPPRAQKGRLLALASQTETHVIESVIKPAATSSSEEKEACLEN
ncbi:hypothetical protein ACFE04_031674 [Oxalis oulophora]